LNNVSHVQFLLKIGIILISLAGFYQFEERLTAASLLWISVIVIGVAGLNLSVKGGLKADGE